MSEVWSNNLHFYPTLVFSSPFLLFSASHFLRSTTLTKVGSSVAFSLKQNDCRLLDLCLQEVY